MNTPGQKACPACTAPNPSAAKFCLECGAAFPRSCPSCNAALVQRARFCTECGHGPLDASAAPAASAPAAPEQLSPRRPHTPKHIVERVLKARRHIEGERKSVTVLFADIKGSTDLIETRDPEEARQILEPVLQAMVAAVHRFDGVVSKFMGDGLMALFGAPLALEDHAVRACYAAVMMQEAVSQRSDRLRAEYGVEVEVRIGMHSGEVVVLSVGSDVQMEFDAVGATVHLAARMEQLAPGGSIRISGDTARLLGGRMVLNDLGAVPIRGFSDAVPVFELVGVRATDSESAGEVDSVPMVGRETECTSVLARARLAADGSRGQAILLLGEAGIGKTRLCRAIAQDLGQQGWIVLESRAAPHEPREPWLIASRLLRSRLGPFGGDAASEDIMTRVTELGLEEAAAGLFEILGRPVSDSAWRALKPEQRRRRMIDSCRGWLMAESRIHPICISVDDLQWIDGESETLLREMVDAVGHARILLLMAARADSMPDWAERGSVMQVKLQPLSVEESEVLVRHLLPRDLSEALKAHLVERAGGNPLFLGEVARSLSESSRLTPDGTAEALPLTVQSIIAARLDDLASGERRVIEAAAVIGSIFELELLADVLSIPPEEIRAAISRLQERAFFREHQIFPELQYAFQHPLAVEVTYRGLLRAARQSLHRAVLDSLMRHNSVGRSPLAARLALHAVGAEAWTDAVKFSHAAARQAMARSAHQVAAELYGSALQSLARLPPEPNRMAQGIDLRIELRHALLPLGSHAEIDLTLSEARKAAEAIDDQPRLAAVLLYQTALQLSTGRSSEALETGSQALRLGEEIGDATMVRDVIYYLVQANVAQGNYAEAADLCEAFVTYPAMAPSELTMLSLGRLWLTWCLAEIGQFERAEAHAEQALVLARGGDDPLPMLLAQLGRGLVLLMQECAAEAVAWFEPALAMSEKPTLRAWWVAVASPLARALTLLGRASEAIPLLEEVVSQAATGRGGGHALRSVHLGEAYLAVGRIQKAALTAERALELAKANGERGHQAYAHFLLAMLSHYPCANSSDEDHLKRAVDLAAEIGMTPLLNRIEQWRAQRASSEGAQ